MCVCNIIHIFLIIFSCLLQNVCRSQRQTIRRNWMPTPCCSSTHWGRVCSGLWSVQKCSHFLKHSDSFVYREKSCLHPPSGCGEVETLLRIRTGPFLHPWKWTIHSARRMPNTMYIILAMESFPIILVYFLLSQDIKLVRCLHVAMTVIGLWSIGHL